MKNENYDEMADAAGIRFFLMEPREHFDPCVLTLASRNDETFVVYDTDKVLETLCKHQGMEREEAREWFFYNMKSMHPGYGAWAFTEDLV